MQIHYVSHVVGTVFYSDDATALVCFAISEDDKPTNGIKFLLLKLGRNEVLSGHYTLHQGQNRWRQGERVQEQEQERENRDEVLL